MNFADLQVESVGDPHEIVGKLNLEEYHSVHRQDLIHAGDTVLVSMANR